MLKDILKKIMETFSASSSTKAVEKPTPLNVETCKIILETLRKEFEAEEDRNKHIEDKAKTFITLIGILLTTSGFLIKAIVENSWFSWLTFIVLLAIVILVVSLWYLLLVFQARAFERINIEPLLQFTEMATAPEIVASRLVATYEQALVKNRKTVDDKLKNFNAGVNLIKGSVALIFVVFLTIAIEDTDYCKKSIVTINKPEQNIHGSNAVPFGDGKVFLNNESPMPNIEIALPYKQKIIIEYEPRIQKGKEVRK